MCVFCPLINSRKKKLKYFLVNKREIVLDLSENSFTNWRIFLNVKFIVFFVVQYCLFLLHLKLHIKVLVGSLVLITPTNYKWIGTFHRWNTDKHPSECVYIYIHIDNYMYIYIYVYNELGTMTVEYGLKYYYAIKQMRDKSRLLTDFY